MFPFGYGLSYSKFTYGEVKLSSVTLNTGQTIIASVTVTNSGTVDGVETVQLYIRDVVGSISRPMKELKGFKKVAIKAGQSSTVQFSITANDLKFYNSELKYVVEPGDFKVFIGGNSKEVKESGFKFVK